MPMEKLSGGVWIVPNTWPTAGEEKSKKVVYTGLSIMVENYQIILILLRAGRGPRRIGVGESRFGVAEGADRGRERGNPQKKCGCIPLQESVLETIEKIFEKSC